MQNSFDDYKVVYQFARKETENDAATRARDLAAMKRLYCVEFDSGTWL